MSTEEETQKKFLSYLTDARYILSAVSVLVVAQPSSEVPEGFTNYSVRTKNVFSNFFHIMLYCFQLSSVKTQFL